ncbi:MAG TPA: methylmalonyl Co-A mutase-associated GTPase MeaB [Gemmatimonadales bacterium]|nr:methylmalonyl Co-A mutase-associated GTPase MeaB [Gemmatimonadales bacterium]
MDPTQLIADLRTRQPAALARAISLVENGRHGFEELLSRIHPSVGRARRIGVTGPPGAGKSTLTEQLVRAFRAQDLMVAVVAVDPTSPFTGGALLGDRIRMESVALDAGVFIRSMATRGSLGGLATTTREVCDVLDAGGFDRIIIETVGVGQSELDVGRSADSTLLVLVPESGDGIQALKSGVMEIADLFVVNKADRPGADRMRNEIEATLSIRAGSPRRHARVSPDGWNHIVLTATASQGEGIAAVVDGLEQHHQWLLRSGSLVERRRARLLDRTREVVNRAVRAWLWNETTVQQQIEARLDALSAGQVSPYEVANDVMDGLKALS